MFACLHFIFLLFCISYPFCIFKPAADTKPVTAATGTTATAKPDKTAGVASLLADVSELTINPNDPFSRPPVAAAVDNAVVDDDDDDNDNDDDEDAKKKEGEAVEGEREGRKSK